MSRVVQPQVLVVACLRLVHGAMVAARRGGLILTKRMQGYTRATVKPYTRATVYGSQYSVWFAIQCMVRNKY